MHTIAHNAVDDIPMQLNVESLPDLPNESGNVSKSEFGEMDQQQLSEERQELSDSEVMESESFQSSLRDANREEVEQAPEVSVTTSVDDCGKVLVEVVFDNHKTRALIDTGSTRSLVSERWIREKSIPSATPPPLIVRGVGHSRVNVQGSVTAELVLHGLKMKACDFLVIESFRDSDVPIVLGEEFLSDNNISINVRRRVISCPTAAGIFSIFLGDKQSPCRVVRRDVPCQLTDDVVLDPHDVMRTKVRLQGSEELVACSFCEKSQQPTLWLTEPIVGGRPVTFPGICGDQDPEILLSSRSETPMKLKRGTVVCMATTLQEREECTSEIPQVAVASLEGLDSRGSSSNFDLSELAMGPDLTPEERKGVKEMLMAVREVFSVNDFDVGRLDGHPHRIELLDDFPIYQKPRRFNEPVSLKISEQCRELELLDIIEPSCSAWSSPVVPVIKRDGSLRLCIDYRRLNEVTKPDRHPLPNLTDSVYSLYGVNYFTSLDLVKGYYQLPLAEESRELTAFSTPTGHYQFKRLPFGLRNAPASFQRAMQQVLGAFPRQQVIVYIDDLLIMSATFEEHVQLVKRVLSTLKNHGMKVKPAKCRFFESEVEFLGHIVGRDGIRKSPEYVRKVAEMPRPETVGGLREFLGLLNFQRKFVPGFSEIQKCLSEKTSGKRTKRLDWSEEMEKAFVLLKAKVCEDVTLSFPDYQPDAQPLRLYTDASGIGAGACLTQIQKGDVRTIAYASTSFNKAERQYSTIERELAALRWAVKTFRPYLIGSHFEVYTDHQPLVYLHNMKVIDARLARTLEDLADFSFRVIYLPGRENVAADRLSRLCQPDVYLESDDVVGMGELPDGLEVAREVSGGGDSLFQSLHFLSERTELKRGPCASVEALRKLLVEDALRKPDMYGLQLDQRGRKHLRAMSVPGKLPSMDILLVFSNLFQCRILVHFGSRNPVWFIAKSLDGTVNACILHLQCRSGIHFNPVREMRGYECPAQPKARMSDSEPSEEREEPADDVQLSDIGAVSISWCPWHALTHRASSVIEVADRKFCVLLDTGAQVNCASYSFAMAHNVAVNDGEKQTIRGIGPNVIQTLGSVELPIALPGMSTSHSVLLAVVEDAAIPTCVVLGVRFLRESSLEIDYCRGGYWCGRKFTDFPCRVVFSIADVVSLPLEQVLPVDVREVRVGLPPDCMNFSVGRDGYGKVTDITPILDYDEIVALQESDSCLRAVKQAVLQNLEVWPKVIRAYSRHKSQLEVNDGLLIHKSDLHSVVVVTQSVLLEILLVAHYQMAHLGRGKLIELIGQHVWHFDLGRCAGDITSTCDVCQRMKVSPSVAKPPVTKVQSAYPYELLAVDCLMLRRSGPFVACLVAMDHCSKWLSAVPLASKTGSAVAKAFEQRILPGLLATPSRVLSDNGTEFVSEQFNTMLSRYSIKHTYTTPYKPSSNGLVERANRTLVELLRVQNAGSAWPQILPKALIVHNGTYHSTLKCSPSDFLLRQSHTMRDPLLIDEDTVAQWCEGHPAFRTFEIGQEVLRKAVLIGNRSANKFEPRWEGPYEVVAVNANGVTYKIRHIDKQAVIKVHHQQLRAYLRPPAYLAEHPYFRTVGSIDEVDDGKQPRDLPASRQMIGALLADSDTDSDSYSGSSDSVSSLTSLSAGSFGGSLANLGCGGEWSDVGMIDPPVVDVDWRAASFDDPSDAENTNVGELNSEFNPSAELADLSWDDEFVGGGADVSVDANVIGRPATTCGQLCPVASVKDKCLEILDEGLKVVNSSSSLIKLALSLSCSDDDNNASSSTLSPVMDKLKELEKAVVEVNNRFRDNPSISESGAHTIAERAGGSALLPDKVIQTRSRGSVPVLPNVMSRPLEYRRRRCSTPCSSVESVAPP